MSTDWINRVVQQKADRVETEKRAIEMERKAARDCGNMFLNLALRMEKDVNTFRSASGNHSVTVNRDRETGLFEVKNLEFPGWFVLALSAAGPTVITVALSKKPTSATPIQKESEEIRIVAKPACYYVLRGQEYASESDVSEQLLAPLLAAL